jgi:hypothetical protein
MLSVYGRGFSQVTACCLEATSTIAYDQQRSSGGAVVGQSRGAGKTGSTKPHPHSLLPVPTRPILDAVEAYHNCDKVQMANQGIIRSKFARFIQSTLIFRCP